MIMTINKKINDKNNSKLKTFQIIIHKVKQSKIMFLFIFVLFQQHSSSTSSNFISSIFNDEYHLLTFVIFYLSIVIIMHILIDLFYCVDPFFFKKITLWSFYFITFFYDFFASEASLLCFFSVELSVESYIILSTLKK